MADQLRDYAAIERAGAIARKAVWERDLGGIAEAVRGSYGVQRGEGMDPLPGDPEFKGGPDFGAGAPLAFKYSGGGFGGYAVYLFKDEAARDGACRLGGFRPIEPYCARA